MVRLKCLSQIISWVGGTRDRRCSGFNYRNETIFTPKELAIMHVYWLLSDSYSVGGDMFKGKVRLLCKAAYFFQDTPAH